ncbi:MAG TPA: hypothetical protein VHB20_09065 [Verrucomicrobiae bacterium]|jgi:hypothetical protein|nr:hypothetical protein [Verrucomicrobiae bacterium]
MKKLIFSLAACVSILGGAESALAFNYHYGDLLLVFRSAGQNDVEFNLGSVSNYLNLAPGTVQTVAGWDASLVTANRNGNSLEGGKFILLATAGKADPSNQGGEADFLTGPGSPFPKDISQSAFSAQNSVITTVGTNAQLFTAGSVGTSAVIASSQSDSYTRTASGSGNDPTKLGGTSAFNVETTIPGAARFYDIGSVNGANPPVGAWVGTFSLDSNNVLTYTAGKGVADAVTLSIVDNGDGSVSISFPTTAGVNYQLLTSSVVAGPLSLWNPAAAGYALGTGGTITILDAPSSDETFYAIQSY